MFAKKAVEEGYEQIAALFNETADNERVHAEIFFKFLTSGEALEITAAYPAGVIGSTYENLMAAAHGENEEYTILYPMFANVADEEGFKDVATAYRMISKVEYEHEKRYLKLADNVEKALVYAKQEETSWKCRECGYVHHGAKAPGVCPTCKKPQSYFEIKESNY
jgi:rubrerythrin